MKLFEGLFVARSVVESSMITAKVYLMILINQRPGRSREAQRVLKFNLARDGEGLVQQAILTFKPPPTADWKAIIKVPITIVIRITVLYLR